MIHSYISMLIGRYAELEVSVLDVGLTEVEEWLLHHVLPDCGEGPVSPHHQVGADLYRVAGQGPRITHKSINNFGKISQNWNKSSIKVSTE